MFIDIKKHNSDNHNDCDNDKMNRHCYNLLMVICDKLFWCQLFVSTLQTKMTIRNPTKNGACWILRKLNNILYCNTLQKMQYNSEGIAIRNEIRQRNKTKVKRGNCMESRKAAKKNNFLAAYH